MLAPGTEFSVEAAVMSHADDWIGNGGNSLVLFAKYFTADWGWIGMDASMPFNGNASKLRANGIILKCPMLLFQKVPAQFKLERC